MWKFFKRNTNGKSSQAPSLQLLDLTGTPMQEGDEVECLRYELGRCRITRTESGYAYESMETGETVSWIRMVDAATKHQKVRKI